MERTHADLAAAIIAGLDDTYELVYVSQGDRLTDDQLATLVRGDEIFSDPHLEEWESDQRDHSAEYIVMDAAKDVVRAWEREDEVDYDELLDAYPTSGDPWHDVIMAVQDRDRSDWLRDLVRGNGAILLRVTALDEDHAFSFQPVSPVQALAAVGLPLTDDNMTTMGDTLAECSPEYSVLMGYWIAGVDAEAIYDLTVDADGYVELTDPYLYLGNPFAGSGWISEKPFTGVVRVKRGDLRTDKDAFGYSATEVFGGLSGSSFPVEIREVV